MSGYFSEITKAQVAEQERLETRCLLNHGIKLDWDGVKVHIGGYAACKLTEARLDFDCDPEQTEDDEAFGNTSEDAVLLTDAQQFAIDNGVEVPFMGKQNSRGFAGKLVIRVILKLAKEAGVAPELIALIEAVLTA